MSALDDLVLDPIENALDAVGLMSGPAAPILRAGVGAGIGAAISFGIKPDVMFFPDGSPRPWSVTDPKASGATMLPYWAPIFGGAVVLGVFI